MEFYDKAYKNTKIGSTFKYEMTEFNDKRCKNTQRFQKQTGIFLQPKSFENMESMQLFIKGLEDNCVIYPTKMV